MSWPWASTRGAVCPEQGAPWTRALMFLAPFLLLAIPFLASDHLNSAVSNMRLGWTPAAAVRHQSGGIPGSHLNRRYLLPVQNSTAQYQDSTDLLTKSPAAASNVVRDTACGRPSGGAPQYDVIFMLVNHAARLSKDGFKMSDAQLNITAEMALPSSRVHVLTDDDDVIAQMGTLASTLPWGDRLHVRDVRPILAGPRDAFLAVYKHQSVNPKEYEAYCFWRWGVIHAYVDELAQRQPGVVSRILTLDADVVPSRPVTQWLPRGLDETFGRTVSLVKLSPGAVNLWTPAEIAVFWDFIQTLYADSERTQWWVRRHGNSFGGCRGHEVIPCEDGKQFHVSDMHAFDAFLAESPTTRRSLVTGEELHNARNRAAHAQMLEGTFGTYLCVPMARTRNFRGPWSLILSNGPELSEDPRSPRGWNVMMTNVELPACYLHFQGRSKWAIPQFCDFIETRQNGSFLNPVRTT